MQVSEQEGLYLGANIRLFLALSVILYIPSREACKSPRKGLYRPPHAFLGMGRKLGGSTLLAFI